MSATSRPLVHELVADNKCINIHREGAMTFKNTLQVSFQRTIRVSDNNTTNKLPPSMGCFPLSKVSDCKGLPLEMKTKAGYFFPNALYVPSQ
jgi:hypothetical protein